MTKEEKIDKLYEKLKEDTKKYIVPISMFKHSDGVSVFDLVLDDYGEAHIVALEYDSNGRNISQIDSDVICIDTLKTLIKRLKKHKKDHRTL